MLKRFATTVVVLAVVGGSALSDAKMGGVARQISMGGVGGAGIALNPFIFEDPAYQYINPAYQGLYKDYGWANIGGNGGSVTGLTTGANGYGMQHGGMNFSLGEGIAIGTVLAYDPSALNILMGAMANPLLGGAGYVSGPPIMAPPAAEVLEVVGSYGWDHSHFGLGVMYGWTSQDMTTTAGKSELTGSVIGFRAGIHQDLGSGNAWEASATFRSNSADDKSPTVSGSGSLTEFGVSGRAKLRVNNKVNFVPIAAFATASGDVTYPTPSVPSDISVTALAVGVGAELNYSSLYLAGGFSYAMAKNEVTIAPTTASNTVTSFPTFNVGGEWWFTDWLAGRAGYFRAFTNFKTETPGGTTTETNFFSGTSFVGVGGYGDNNLIVLGLAARWGDFSLETTVSEEALRRGFGLAGGSDDINSFGYMTAGWNWQ